ncbi:MAG: L-aspartate oxidase [Pseudomonadota bacterium]|nr:L-aspartate oxidase [Pseudomonadota bacterium]
MIKTDVLIIGSGAAGMTAAIELSNQFNITLITKNSLVDSSTWYAQGGIAAVIDSNDSIEEHLRDTLIAGDGLCDENAVRQCVSHGKEAIEWLSSLGTNFTTDKSRENLHLTQEGGHSKRRVVHAEDATGREVSSSLSEMVKRSKTIEVLENHICVDLITRKEKCIGAYVLDIDSNTVKAFSSGAVILATGGASKVYLYTSNPDGSSGDGIGLAWRAGCKVENLEFNQFHPTCLFHPEAKSFLISEALRGEGAFLVNHNKEKFMEKYDARLELAPRDVVARSIDKEMKISGADNVFLDISHKNSDEIKEHFPNIYSECLRFGYDLTAEPIPVVPAAHYTCGGVKVDLNSKTNIDNLYAIGEVSSTGLHGANRMASNSLLECVVFAKKASDHICKNFKNHNQEIQEWDISKVTETQEGVIIRHNWDDIRRLMWDYVGIVRSNNLLKRAEIAMKVIDEEVNYFYGKYLISSDLIELRNLALVANLIIKSAQKRKESRGLHYSLDYPNLLNTATPTILDPSKIKI